VIDQLGHLRWYLAQELQQGLPVRERLGLLAEIDCLVACRWLPLLIYVIPIILAAPLLLHPSYFAD
jgi:hypothetical protein